MILHRSDANHAVIGRPGSGAPRARIGILVLIAIVAMLTLLNVAAGSA